MQRNTEVGLYEVVKVHIIAEIRYGAGSHD
jgi:hypothetical protein